MKIKLHKYSRSFPKLFAVEKSRIGKAFAQFEGYEIHHVGSTAVEGLGGKGIIDIMVAIKDWKKQEDYIKALKSIGYRHVHPEERGRIFLSKIRRTKKGDTHLHLVKQGSKDYEVLLKFRDLLKRSKKAREDYWQTKLALYEETVGDRLKFGKLKDKYIKEVLKAIR